MDKELKNYHGFWFREAKVVLLFFFVAAVFWYVSVYSRSVVPQRSFVVSGEGKIVAVPDIARISIGVLTEGGKNLADLQKQNTEKTNRIISYLKGQGIDQKDIKTEYYNISPRYQYFSCPPVPLGVESRPCPPSEIIGYSISQSISVKVRDLSKVGALLTGVVEGGANNVSGPNFTVDDPAALENQAREEAVKKAKEKARSVARAGGFRLGKVISIQEGFVSPYLPIAFEARGGAIPSPSIEPGSQEIVVNVTLVYEIK
ncbi:MAG: SIMPL domain-containing protein [Parcubacteria group bacterium]|nr:SIMPL domain-containing protein [Parcubacteria group bacterium]